ncbi:hypothetical protein QZH41_013504 [Actinostola sp. cb2023]|nr:hypothetical protein QZH41_013504 [Actinostola sp. cb2023]
MADKKHKQNDSVCDEETQPQCKKAKIEGQGEGLESFKGFEITKTLSENARSKSVFLHGKFEGCDDDAVVLLEKTPFSQDVLPKVLSSDTRLTVDMRNDIYGQYICYPPQDTNTIKCTVIYPATSKHITKYTSQQTFIVNETPEDYKSITLPFLEAQQFNIQWVYNILDKQAEVERIQFEDPDCETGFILLPDMKWDQRQVENLYLVAICQQRHIKSLRDIDDSSLPLLKNILAKGKGSMQEQFVITIIIIIIITITIITIIIVITIIINTTTIITIAIITIINTTITITIIVITIIINTTTIAILTIINITIAIITIINTTTIITIAIIIIIIILNTTIIITIINNTTTIIIILNTTIIITIINTATIAIIINTTTTTIITIINNTTTTTTITIAIIIIINGKNYKDEVIKSKYKIPSSQLRIYIHYQPSYYHLHVHFTHLKFDAPGSGAGKAHLLEDVIDNIANIDKNYYQKKTLPFVARESDKLFLEFQRAGRV